MFPISCSGKFLGDNLFPEVWWLFKKAQIGSLKITIAHLSILNTFNQYNTLTLTLYTAKNVLVLFFLTTLFHLYRINHVWCLALVNEARPSSSIPEKNQGINKNKTERSKRDRFSIIIFLQKRKMWFLAISCHNDLRAEVLILKSNQDKGKTYVYLKKKCKWNV